MCVLVFSDRHCYLCHCSNHAVVGNSVKAKRRRTNNRTHNEMRKYYWDAFFNWWFECHKCRLLNVYISIRCQLFFSSVFGKVCVALTIKTITRTKQQQQQQQQCLHVFASLVATNHVLFVGSSVPLILLITDDGIVHLHFGFNHY